MPAPVVAVLAFDRISPFHLSVPCLIFGESRPGTSPFRLSVCAVEAGALMTSVGFGITVERGLDALCDADIVIVPSWHDPLVPPPAPLLDALAAAAARGARMVGLCLGAFVLAEAGLLDGKRATTHWAWAPQFRSLYPAVQLDADVLYVEDGAVLTSAGTSAGIDCCLHLLRQYCGAEEANRVARRLVMPPYRQGGQAQYIEQALPVTPRDSRLAGLLDWVRANLGEPHTLDSLASKSLLSRRTFTRRFRLLTGGTVGAWLLGERLALCQRLLETTDQSIDAIASLAGFGSGASFRLHFGKAFRVSPSAWRKTFRGH
ncbi:GlxA family transcriptional regulator [Paludibacterium yongneupense]|uniref:GlxA family transcriptional regulator n=1 Tax=Paludibacterium yongneupense TaxID=400061 RepID=UPI0003FCFF35|nr:helix-turn-helix domain-containing protein [Paludibacterium yongneupense]